MAKKTDSPDIVTDSTSVSAEKTEPITAAEQPAGNVSRIWVYMGPSIRGVVVNGRVFKGTRAEVLQTLESGIREYPQIERLIVADCNITKARNDMKEKRGIYIPYETLMNRITGKEG